MTLPQLEQAFLQFRSWVTQKINEILARLEEAKSCCQCKSQFYVREFENWYFFNEDGSPATDAHSFYNDVFPLDEICIGDNAILVVNDATIYLTYTGTYDFNDPNSGWQVLTYSVAGKQKVGKLN